MVSQHGKWTLDQSEARRKLTVRPRLEVLEGRALMALTSFDATFGGRGVIQGTADPGGGTELSRPADVVVQSDGKTLVDGTFGRPVDLFPPLNSYAIRIAVRRYNVDGSLDTSFGTNGQVDIPIPSDYTGDETFGLGRSLAINSDGSIVVLGLAANLPALESPGVNLKTESFVARLTPSGQLDSTFGTAGEVTLPGADGIAQALAIQPDGAIVVAGHEGNDPTNTDTSSDDLVSIVRLTPVGALDASFNGTGSVALDIPDPFNPDFGDDTRAVGITPTGQIVVAFNQTYSTDFEEDSVTTSGVAVVTAAGALDSSFGTGGYVNNLTSYRVVQDLAIQPDGKILLIGLGPVDSTLKGDFDQSSNLTRLTATGAVDPSFTAFATGDPTQAGEANNGQYSTVTVAENGLISIGGKEDAQLSRQFVQEFAVREFLADGTPNPSFGVNGKVEFYLGRTASESGLTTIGSFNQVDAITTTSDNKIVVVGHLVDYTYVADNYTAYAEASVVVRLLPVAVTQAAANDYDGDGKSDVAAELAAFGLFASRPSDGAADSVTAFGPAGLGQTIPAPGDYDGDGKTDIAAYLPAYGVLAYRPSSGGADVIVPFGIPGAGQSIPAPGDYDGDGKTDVAVYLPALGILAYRPSSGGADVLVPFGIPGAGQSIPAPGDYDGDGKTDVAVYLPALGILAYRPSLGGADVLTPFGIAGAGQSIPVPGDYDGDFKTDVAVYLPVLGDFAYRPSTGGVDVVEHFGIAGAGQSIPAPGDYDGDGKTDFAVYLPALADFAYRPSSGGADVVEQFGIAGTGQTVPASSIPYAQPDPTSSSGTVSSQSVAVSIPLGDEVLGLDASTTVATKKKRASRLG